MRQTPIYFDNNISLIHIFRAAEAIGCTVKPDRGTGMLCVTYKNDPDPESEALASLLGVEAVPACLKPQEG
jgi:hypothetical protein